MRKIVVALAAGLALSCGVGDRCENSAPVDVPSPDGARVAWIFTRSCGATTRDSVHVSILPSAASAPTEGGNTFVVEQRGSVELRWLGERELSVSFEPLGTIFRQESEVSGVHVSYHRS